MNRRVPVPNKSYQESPKEHDKRAQASPNVSCSDFEYAKEKSNQISFANTEP